MDGKLGAIYIGKKQVGGFLDWKVALNLTDGSRDGDKTHKLQSWKLVARAHWLSQRLEPDTEIRLKLCADAGSAYWEGTGRIACQLTTALETLIHTQLEVIGSGELEGKQEMSSEK